MSRNTQHASFTTLDDSCILNVLSWLDAKPDRFSMAQVCKRLRTLASSETTSLLVSSKASGRGNGMGGRPSSCYRTLAEAVSASRPGDTIQLQAGETHVVQEVTINWPLTLRSTSSTADAHLECKSTPSEPIEAGLIFRASARMEGLSVAAWKCATLLHCSGTLRVTGCSLSVASDSLGHLYHPMVTTAMSSPPEPPAPEEREAAQAPSPLDVKALARQAAAKKLMQILRGARKRARPVAGPGVLHVKETKIMGGQGSTAVLMGGTGCVTGVRALPLSGSTVFWLTVNSEQGSPPLHKGSAQQSTQNLTLDRSAFSTRHTKAFKSAPRTGPVLCSA